MQMQYVRDTRKVKGYCRICNAWRVFELHFQVALTRDYFAVGQITPFTEHVGNKYFGKCSHGHKVYFDAARRPVVPSYKREPTWLYASGRGRKQKEQYLSWLHHFRDWMREQHFNDSNHECNENCPEFDWSIYDD